MKSLFIFLLLATTCNSARGQVQDGNSTIHDDEKDTSSATSTTYSSLGSLLLLVLIGYLIWYLCKHRDTETPPQRLQNEEDPNNATRPRQNNRRRRWWYRRNRNYFHQNPNMSPNVHISPVINVGIHPQDINPPVAEGMFRNPGIPNFPPPPPPYCERSDNVAPNSNRQAHGGMQANYVYAPDFNQYHPACNANNPPSAPDFRQTNTNATPYTARQNNTRYPPNQYY